MLDDVKSVPPTEDAVVTTTAEALKENTAAAAPTTVTEDDSGIIDVNTINVGNPGATKVPDEDGKPDEEQEETSDQTSVAPPSKPPSEFISDQKPAKDQTDGTKVSDLDSKPSNVLIPSTVQYTDPDLLPTSNNGQVSPINLDYGEDDSDYEDGFDTDATYVSNLDNKDQSKNRLSEPDGLDFIRYQDSYNSEDEDSHFFFHLVILAFLVAIIYITYHNKRKVRGRALSLPFVCVFVFISCIPLSLLLLFRSSSWLRADAGKMVCVPGTRWSTTAWTRTSTRPCRP